MSSWSKKQGARPRNPYAREGLTFVEWVPLPHSDRPDQRVYYQDPDADIPSPRERLAALPPLPVKR
jgi:hypothetical protein